MYRYVEDKKFLHKMRSLSGEMLQDLCHVLKKKYDIGANFYLVGSGARNLILQNENEPIDLDYNLEIVRCDNFNVGRTIKECVKKAFNEVLNCIEKTQLAQQQKMKLQNSYKEVGRNDLCPCGSGKKYKNCCLKISV